MFFPIGASPRNLIALGAGGGVDPLALLQAKGASFFLNDFLGRTDLTFQDAAGTTLSDSASDPVARALGLDQIGNDTLAATMAAQPEKMANGDFASGDLTDWSDGSTGTGSISYSAGGMRILGTDGSNRGRGYQIAALTPGATYLLTWSAAIASGGGDIFAGTAVGLGNMVQVNLAASNQAIFEASHASVYITAGTASGGGDIVVDDISVKQIPGYHAVQSSSTSYRPLRQADGSVKADLLDDSLLSSLTSSTSMFMAVAMLGGANPASFGALTNRHSTRLFRKEFVRPALRGRWHGQYRDHCWRRQPFRHQGCCHAQHRCIRQCRSGMGAKRRIADEPLFSGDQWCCHRWYCPAPVGDE